MPTAGCQVHGHCCVPVLLHLIPSWPVSPPSLHQVGVVPCPPWLSAYQGDAPGPCFASQLRPSSQLGVSTWVFPRHRKLIRNQMDLSATSLSPSLSNYHPCPSVTCARNLGLIVTPFATRPEPVQQLGPFFLPSKAILFVYLLLPVPRLVLCHVCLPLDLLTGPLAHLVLSSQLFPVKRTLVKW